MEKNTATIEYVEKRVIKTDIAGIKKWWRENREQDIKFADISEADRAIISGKKKRKFKL